MLSWHPGYTLGLAIVTADRIGGPLTATQTDGSISTDAVSAQRDSSSSRSRLGDSERSTPPRSCPRTSDAATKPAAGVFDSGGRFGALGYRDFRLAFFGQCISAVGS